MKCKACKGTGKSAKPGVDCFVCNGGGEMCDKCGEATNEPGQNICDQCAEETEE